MMRHARAAVRYSVVTPKERRVSGEKAEREDHWGWELLFQIEPYFLGSIQTYRVNKH
jgi:hypothetical protein